jgi:hypothetical protein
MAGPLNLDNYKIEANESNNDELVITHVPTGKTTRLSEGAFSTEKLSVGSDGPATDFSELGLLAETGFSSGDFFPLKTYYGTATNVSTTSTTYVKFNGTWQPTISLTGFPSGATPAWVGETRVYPGNDETMDLRFNAENDGVTVVEETGITTYQNLVMGPVETDIPGQNSTTFEIRTNPGSNSSRADDPVLIVGVILP